MYQVSSSLTFFVIGTFSVTVLYKPFCRIFEGTPSSWMYERSWDLRFTVSFFAGWQIQACSRNVVEFVKAPKIHKGKGHDKHNKVWDESLLNVKQFHTTELDIYWNYSQYEAVWPLLLDFTIFMQKMDCKFTTKKILPICSSSK